MGIRDLFNKPSKDEVTGTRVLVASLDPKFAALAGSDARCYSLFYSAPTEVVFEHTTGLLEAIAGGYDVLHLFCDVTSDGNISDGQGQETPAARLIQVCLESNVKLLWVASGNNTEAYVKGFKATAGKSLNMVLTMDRGSTRFSGFLENLLRKMSAGDTMPVAWNSLAPQNPNDPRNQLAPACIFAAGRGRVRLR
jgi:hypothetical protein